MKGVSEQIARQKSNNGEGFEGQLVHMRPSVSFCLMSGFVVIALLFQFPLHRDAV